MNKAEWISSNDPMAMLEHMTHARSAPAGMPALSRPRERCLISDRKLRLFACACCRQVWHLLTDERSRKAVEVAERYADGKATEQEFRNARLGATYAFEELNRPFDAELALVCVSEALLLTRNDGLPRWFSVSNKHAASQANLLRDIVGNPWRPVTLPKVKRLVAAPVAEDADYAGPAAVIVEEYPWLTPDVLSLARAAYEDRPGRKCERCKGQWRTVDGYSTREVQEGNEPPRWKRCPTCRGTGHIEDGTLDPARLAVLADALEEAGCTDEVILLHLRGFERCPWCPGHGNEQGCGGHNYRKWPDGSWAGEIHLRGPHVRGCHVVDLILGNN